MNHRPRRPGTGPFPQNPPNRGRHPGPPPRQNYQPGSPPPGMPPMRPQQQPPPGPQSRGQPPRPQPQPKFLNEEYSMPVRQNKPIPASVPSVDVDAIAQALNQCSQEMDHLERSGRFGKPPPEAIDDLIVVDMYTPREKIPVSKRHVAAQTIAMQGPAEEGVNRRQNELIQALKASSTSVNPAENSTDAIPEPTLFDRKPEQSKKGRKKPEDINPMLDVFEAAIETESGQLPSAKPREKRTDLSQDDFGKRLKINEDAYKVSRDAATPGADSGMTRDELHAYYAAQKGGTSQEDLAAQEALLNRQNNTMGSSSGGFLSGMGATDAPQGGGTGISTSGGFLSGLDSGGPEQQSSIASRDVVPVQQQEQSGTSFLDSLNAFKQPSEPQLDPGYDEVWNRSDNISPEAKAYRDRAMATGAVQPPPPNMQGLPQSADQPAFLNKPSHARTPTTPDQARPNQRPQKSRKEKISSISRARRKAMRVFFGKRPVWTLLAATKGLSVIATQGRYDPIREWVVFTPSWILFYGIVVFIGSMLWHFFSARKPKEETLDDWVAEDLVSLEKRAFETLKLQNRYLLLEPIIMSGFPNLDYVDNEFVNGQYGRDHILRYTPRALTVICFTRREVLTYEGAIDLTTGQVVYETAREFFYADVATIGMIRSKVRRRFSVANLVLPWKWFFVEQIIRMLSGRTVDRSATKLKETFQISLKDGNRIQLVLRDARVLRENTFEELAMSTDEKVLKAITDFVVAQKTDQLAGYR